jgi:diketogulonate reductase-like aldo/keto reductase
MTGDGIKRACEGGLARLRADHLDLYLLHWPVPNTEFSHVVRGFKSTVAGKIRSWGVSNFSVHRW